jgi:ABC-type transport system substrate-binding protein
VKEPHARVQQVEVFDPLTARFHLKEPWPDFMTFYGSTGHAAQDSVSSRQETNYAATERLHTRRGSRALGKVIS